MTNENIFNRRPIISLLFITALLSFLLIVILELILRFTPYNFFVDNEHIAFPAMFIADAQAGFDLADNFKNGRHATIESVYPVHTNNIGCFDAEVTLNKSHNILIGDSFTWGFSPLDKKWTTTLENNAKQRFVKCGVPAYGSKQSLLKLKKVIKKIGKAPKTILYSYYWNDLNDDHTGLPSTSLDGILVNRLKSFNYANGQVEYLHEKQLLDSYQQYKKHGVFDYSSLSTYNKIKYWIKSNSIIANIIHNFMNNTSQPEIETLVYGSTAQYRSYLSKMSVEKYPWLEKAWDQHLQNINEMSHYAKSINSQFMVVIMPTKDHIYPKNTSQEVLSNIQQSRIRLKTFLKHKNINYFDLFESFSHVAKNNANLYLSNDLHFSIKGEALAGKLISDFLLDKNYLIPLND